MKCIYSAQGDLSCTQRSSIMEPFASQPLQFKVFNFDESWVSPTNRVRCILLVGGGGQGGSGGKFGGGTGGGGGEVRFIEYPSEQFVTGRSYRIRIGVGGGTPSDTSGGNGGKTIIEESKTGYVLYSADGGFKGNSAASIHPSLIGGRSGTGNNGGQNAMYSGGGGGGSDKPGQNARQLQIPQGMPLPSGEPVPGTPPIAGIGGNGTFIAFHNHRNYYGGGGGGGTLIKISNPAQGGLGGGGTGGVFQKNIQKDGRANTGGGGGGAAGPKEAIGGVGGSGIVIIWW